LAINSPPRKPSAGRRTVAVEIGFSTVKVVEIDGSANDVRLVKRGSAPITAGWWDNTVSARASIAQAIKSAMSAAGVSATQVVATLPRRLVTLKYARLPHAEPEQIHGMVQFEAQQYIPFQLEDVVLDHQIVSEPTDELTTVMIVAAKRDLVEGLLMAFDSAGLEVTRLSVSSLGLAEHARGAVAPIALLDVEPGEMDMAIVADGRLLFSRSASLTSAMDNVVDSKVLAGEVARSFAACWKYTSRWMSCWTFL
jgi:type IV pilus assembly protein PilM